MITELKDLNSLTKKYVNYSKYNALLSYKYSALAIVFTLIVAYEFCKSSKFVKCINQYKNISLKFWEKVDKLPVLVFFIANSYFLLLQLLL